MVLYSFGPASNPTSVYHTTTHHFPGWLLYARDNPAKASSIEIYNAAEYQRMRLHYNCSGLILHEICHIIHQHVLPGGLGNAMIIELHEISEQCGKYAKVLRRDWALKDVDTDMAYCILNHKEFFAEISVAFLADFYQDVGAGTTIMAKCSPPFVSPAIIERIRQQSSVSMRSCVSGTRLSIMVVPHCAKFFPFTRSQLRRYDPRVFKSFVKLWQFIEDWEDFDGRRCYDC
ncbi:hypothetical protein ACHAW5_002000 [Stephanodiscus triporus]|uniref:SprT-like domain-containing protein n=1 Tax=Stephanodiscus triporus TaxID=2934178 RepID=A0ABD3QLZ4_9STRA